MDKYCWSTDGEEYYDQVSFEEAKERAHNSALEDLMEDYEGQVSYYVARIVPPEEFLSARGIAERIYDHILDECYEECEIDSPGLEGTTTHQDEELGQLVIDWFSKNGLFDCYSLDEPECFTVEVKRKE